MYGYAIGRTTPSTLTYRSHKYVVLQFFHRNGIETVYFTKQEYWPFVKTVSGILNQRSTIPKWLQELEKNKLLITLVKGGFFLVSSNTSKRRRTSKRNKVRNWSGLYTPPNDYR
jgi:hypothetical protein